MWLRSYLLSLYNADYMRAQLFCAINLPKVECKQLRVSQ